MDREELIQRLMVTYLEELQVHVDTLSKGLIALEAGTASDGRSELLRTLFRSAHSLKGASRVVGQEALASACHALEDILVAIRDGRLELDKSGYAVALSGLDALIEAGERLRRKEKLEGAPVHDAVVSLQRLARGEPVAVPGPFASSTPTRTPDAARPDAARPNAATSDAARPNPARPNAATSDAATSDAARPDPATSDAARPDPSRPDPSRLDPARLDPARLDPSRLDPSRLDPARLESARATADMRPGTPPPSSTDTRSLDAHALARISFDRLDRLESSSGELAIARRRVASHLEALSERRDWIERWLGSWRTAEPKLHAAIRGGHALDAECRRAITETSVGLRRLVREIDRMSSSFRRDCHRLDLIAEPLEAEIRRVRMSPFSDVEGLLSRAARDAASATEVEVELEVFGKALELDRAVLEGLKDPLVQLVKNAVVHGAETAKARLAKGKPEKNRISVSARLVGSNVEIAVEDDGRGLDLCAIAAQAATRGLATPQDPRALATLIFLPDFSTAVRVSPHSGRGVGLDVVKRRVELLHGSVRVASEAGRGTRFAITVPLTLSAIRALIVLVGGTQFAFASSNIVSLLRFGGERLRLIEGREFLVHEDGLIPVASLGQTMGIEAREGHRAGQKFSAVMVAAGDTRMAFVVDHLLAEQEIVVKGLGPRPVAAPHVAGATILPDGQIAHILNAAELVRTALGRKTSKMKSGSRVGSPSDEASNRVLVADDSLTTRMLEGSVLEAAGYEVLTAADGLDAWHILEEQQIDLVVADVEMPRMDGVALTEAIRASHRLRALPVVLVTGLESEPDRQRGLIAGASAYLRKSQFDRGELLDTIASLLAKV